MYIAYHSDTPLSSHVHQELSTFKQSRGFTKNSTGGPQKKRQPSNNRLNPQSQPDAHFNGYPLYLQTNHSLHSSVHCVGENYRENAWMHRSCLFRHVCFNVRQKEFVVYQSDEENELEKLLFAGNHFADTANTMTNTSVAIGGINEKWTWKTGVPRLRWFPKVVRGELKTPYYQLDSSVVMIPFHSFAAFNPGHLVWDDWLPLWTLLHMFQLGPELGFQPLLLRFILPGPGLWVSCDFNDEKKELCQKMFDKFLPLFGLSGQDFSTIQDFQLNATGTARQSDLVCAKQGAAGLGMLTDHGLKLHGWHSKDYQTMHNHGRGYALLRFRNWMVSNVGVSPEPLGPDAPYKIVFSVNSSRTEGRSTTFENQMHAVREKFGSKAQVLAVTLKDLTVKEQVEIVSQASIFVTGACFKVSRTISSFVFFISHVAVCGGGAVSATFVPEGASVVLYYKENGGVENNRSTKKPARLGMFSGYMFKSL